MSRSGQFYNDIVLQCRPEVSDTCSIITNLLLLNTIVIREKNPEVFW